MPHSEEIAALGRQIEEAKWELPAQYRLDPAKLALSDEKLKEVDPELHARWHAIQDKQKEWAAKTNSPFGRMSSQDMYRSQAVTMAENLRRSLDHLNKQIGLAIIQGAANLDELKGAQLAVRHHLAEKHAVTGRYDLAAQVEPQEQYREHYLQILEAVYRDDDEACDCGHHHGSGNHSDIRVHQAFVREEVFSLKHGKICFLVKCNGCGFLNVIPEIPTHVKEQRAHRARAHQVAGHLNPGDAAAELTARGHNSRNLLNRK